MPLEKLKENPLADKPLITRNIGKLKFILNLLIDFFLFEQNDLSLGEIHVCVLSTHENIGMPNWPVFTNCVRNFGESIHFATQLTRSFALLFASISIPSFIYTDFTSYKIFLAVLSRVQ